MGLLLWKQYAVLNGIEPDGNDLDGQEEKDMFEEIDLQSVLGLFLNDQESENQLANAKLS